MRLAAELDPHYAQEPYYLRDLAVFLFEDGQFEEAAAIAANVCERDPSAANNALLADCLLCAGQYARAADRFAAVTAERAPEPSDAVWRLKQIAVQEVRALVGDTQVRDPDRAEAAASRIDLLDPALTSGGAWALVEEALKADALNSTAHHRRSVLLLGAGMGEDDDPDVSQAAVPAIAAAVLGPWDEGYWQNAIRLASHAGLGDQTVYDLARAAITKVGDDVVSTVLANQQPPLPMEHARLLDQAARDVADERRNPTMRLRLRSPSGHVEEFVLGDTQETE